MKYDLNAVLDLWHEGLSSKYIADELGMHDAYVRTIVQRARKLGDNRAHQRCPAHNGVFIRLEEFGALGALELEAEARGISSQKLAESILSIVATQELFAAVLDDGKAEERR